MVFKKCSIERRADFAVQNDSIILINVYIYFWKYFIWMKSWLFNFSHHRERFFEDIISHFLGG